jgi:hypothetical protein
MRSPVNQATRRGARAPHVVVLVVDHLARARASAAVAVSLAVVSAIAASLTLGGRALASAPALWSEVTS